jgi:hypothetical protein
MVETLTNIGTAFIDLSLFAESTKSEVDKLNIILGQNKPYIVKQNKYDSTIEFILLDLFSNFPSLSKAQMYIDNVFSKLYPDYQSQRGYDPQNSQDRQSILYDV